MRLIQDSSISPLQQVSVALDLETTGLDSASDEIIEIGAVKFRGDEVVDTFETLVNPRRDIPQFVMDLTGITQREVDAAVPFSAVAGDLLAFLGQLPIVGHNVGFDLSFLESAGLSLTNPRYDTMDLATVFLPKTRGYSLTGLAQELGILHGRPHRALEDSRLCHQLFVALVKVAIEAGPGVLAPMQAIAGRSPWPLAGLLRLIEAAASGGVVGTGGASSLGVLGLDAERLKKRLERPRPLHQRRDLEGVEVQEQEIEDILGEHGVLSKSFPGYEFRPQQRQMAREVTAALDQGRHLVVEAGTGVGKSVAYLLPAILFAARGGGRVVVSTNTINLQEQLISKDIPDLVAILGAELGDSFGGIRAAHLTGRANYLCVRRWSQMAQSGSLTAEEARMACKTLVWLQDTSTGDRSELSIPNRDAYLWDRIAAPSAGECDGREGVCFLRTARARADAAQVVVVNHALLLSDLMSGGSAIPPFDNLIIDEAHHLEEEASRQFGYEIPWHAVDDLGARLAQEVGNVRSGLRVANVAQSRHEQVEGLVGETEAGARRLRETWGLLSSTVAEFVQHHQESGDGNQLRVTLSTRKQPAWSGVEGRWEAFNEALLEAERLVDRLLLALEPLESASLVDSLLELRSWHDRTGELRGRVESFVVSPDIDETVYWVNLARQERTPVLCAAPLRVGPILDESLFSQKRCVVMTSATLSVGGTMDYFCRTVGLSDATELVVGSPFDYEKSALVLVCPEMPGPSDAGYQQALQDALVRVARASQGGVLALFTAHAALQAARRGIKAVLESEGMTVLAQGLDGSPRQLMESARENRNTVLLGTSSLWEGVDLPGEHLRVVVVARLPFNVPTDPVFAARSEHYDNPFNDYAVPQAVLRFRQGFGRLIRSQSDRGVVVALDSRIQSRGYGSVFLRSIPQCTVKRVTLRGLGEEVAGWLDG